MNTTSKTGYPVMDEILESIAPAGKSSTAYDFTNWRVRYVAPIKSEQTFVQRCWIEADSAEYGSCRVFDVPDPDEDQRAAAQAACDVLNNHEALVAVLADALESLRRLPDIDGAYRQTCIKQAEAVLARVRQA